MFVDNRLVPGSVNAVARRDNRFAVRRAKLFVVLRQHRHKLPDEQFQAELTRTDADVPKEQPLGQLAPTLSKGYSVGVVV